MAYKKINKNLNFYFSKSEADLKLYVFIDLREQIRQKGKGISAS